MDACRKECQADTDQSIGTHLQQDARQDHADFGRSIGMGIRQPRMEREHRYLNGKGQVDEQEDQ